MHFRSIGFLPLLMTIMMGTLFVLKFHRESKRTEFAMQLQKLVDESNYDASITWKIRRENYFHALVLLSQAEAAQVDLDELLEETLSKSEVDKAYLLVLVESLKKNLDLAEEYEILTAANMERLANGRRLVIGTGGYEGEEIVLDNVIPFRYSPELEMRYANLLLKPESVLRRYPDQIGEGALATMSACRQAELMSEASYERAVRQMRRSRSL